MWLVTVLVEAVSLIFSDGGNLVSVGIGEIGEPNLQ